MSSNTSIKFPEKHYVGFQARPTHDELPLGFMTPFGTDKAFDKRKSTVDSWASSGGYYGQNVAQNKLPAQTYDNKPLIGFKMGRSVRHGYGWGQGNVKWRIEDPRGFELEITSPNFAQIISFCTIQEGEILEECIWARMGNENVLVPVNSDVYENAIKNTERMSKSASLKDLKIGDSVVMHNGDQGIYYGAMFVTSRKSAVYNSSNNANELFCGDKKRHVFLMQGADGLESRKYFKAMGSPKLSQVFEGKAMTPQEAELDIVKKVKEDDYTLDEATNEYGRSPIAFTVEKMDPATFTLGKVTRPLTDIEKAFEADYPSPTHRNYYYMSKYYDEATVIFDVNGQPSRIDIPDIFNKRTYLPNGANYQTVSQAIASQAANPHYRHHYDPARYTMVGYTVIQNDPSVDGRIICGTLSHGYYGRTNGTEMDVSKVPDDFYYFCWTGKSAAGQEITCYC